MNKIIYQKYADACNKIKLLSDIKASLAGEILEDIGEINTIKTGYGTFSVAKRKLITYSGEVRKLEEETKQTLKDAQQKDILSGKALIEVSRSLMFRSKTNIE